MAARKLKIPDIRQIDPERVVVTYDRASDTLYVLFGGFGEPGISWEIDDNIFLRIDMQEENVIGLQLEAFQRRRDAFSLALRRLGDFADPQPDVAMLHQNEPCTDQDLLRSLDAVFRELDWSAAA
jgi:uncharacterized protein YuzE